MRRGYLGLRSTTCAPRKWQERGSPPGGYLATSVDQLVTLLFAKYTREVAKALPSDQEYPLRGSEKRTARASNGSALGLISGFGTLRTCKGSLTMSAPEGRTDLPFMQGHFRF
jgi:hypothetical protein